MFCTTCGTKNTAESNFCKQCGHSLEKTTTTKISEEDFNRSLPAEEQVMALLERAYRLRKEGHITEAIQICGEALHLRPESTSAHSLLGQLFELNGDKERALQEYEQVLRLNPGSIADRVKRDELRDNSPAHPQGATPPHVLLSHPPPRQSDGLSWGVMLGAAGIMLVVGGLIGMQWKQSASASDKAPGTVANATNSTNPRQNSLPLPGNSQTQQNLQTATNTQPPSNTGNPGNPNFANGTNFNGTNSVIPPPTYYGPPQQPVRTVYVQAPPPKSASLVGLRLPQSSSKKDSQTGSGNSRVMLASDGDGVTEDGQGRYVVRINADDANKPKATDPPKGKPKSGEGSIQISTSNTTKTGESTNGSSTNVGSYIAIAAEQKQKGQYSEAIKTYQKALSTAGDETGYVYQQIAYCYQSKGEKPSAATNYQRAISEYQKLVDSGKQAEKAKDGIRACERGVKICNGE